MNYLFFFMLISSLSVGVITYILAFALFFRKKTLLELFFLLFLTFFTLRMISDTLQFYIAPLIASPNLLYYILMLFGRITLCGALFFLTLFIHKLVGKAQSRRAYIILFSISGSLTLFFIIQFILSHLHALPSAQTLNYFSPVDFLFFILFLYPIIFWLIFSRNIRNATLYKTTRTFILGILCLYPFFIIEDLLDTLNVEVGSVTIELKFFPIYYLFLYLMLLYQGFKNLIVKQKLNTGLRTVNKDFISHYRITDRETEIITLVFEGLSNREIAEKLFISSATVRNHLHNIFEKTHVSNRVELLRLCTE
ncbi:MAG: helix-turn-helix transcriptional regulator [Spirochaetales bacterium]|nr:helix-turn-helix transcriptional regulator [Spirochaetales bacterium]